MSRVNTSLCPECGRVGCLRIELRLVATNELPGGTQLRFAATETPFLVCAECGMERAGRIEDENGVAYAVFDQLLTDAHTTIQRRVTEQHEGE